MSYAAELGPAPFQATGDLAETNLDQFPIDQKQVLLIEDNAFDALVFQKMLARADTQKEFWVRCATSLDDAFQVLRAQKIHAIVLDLLLPDASGLEALKKIREAYPETAVIVLTNQESGGIGGEAIQAGAQEFVTKGSIDFRALKNLIEHAIEREAAVHRKPPHSSISKERKLDSITGFPMHDLFELQLKPLIAQAQRQKNIVGFLLIQFKESSRTFHVDGDELSQRSLIRAIASKLALLIRTSDIATRLNNDTFAVALTHLKRPHDIYYVSQRILNQLSGSYSIHDRKIKVDVHIGASYCPYDGSDLHYLEISAEVALKESKLLRKAQTIFSSSILNIEIKKKTRRIKELHSAFLRGEMLPFFQPVFDLHTGRVKSFQTLLRWNHSKNGPIPARYFLKTLKERGLLTKTNLWLLKQGCFQLKRWKREGFEGVKLFFHLTKEMLADPGFSLVLQKLLRRLSLSSSSIGFEITEVDLLTTKQLNALGDLHQRGFAIYLNNFGTGISSLSQLSKFPLTGLKIDRSITRKFMNKKEAEAILHSALLISKALHLDVIAEGIETRDQKALLQKAHCLGGQGYYLSKPLSAKSASDLLHFVGVPA